MQQTRAAPPATLDAVLERITYANQETGYTVARVATDRSGDLLTVVGGHCCIEAEGVVNPTAEWRLVPASRQIE
jgi:exodeoxyribonuclease V alpha subunit